MRGCRWWWIGLMLVLGLGLGGCPGDDGDDDASDDASDDDASDDDASDDDGADDDAGDDDTDQPPPDAICDAPVELTDTTTPDLVVGDGSAASCTEAALAAAIAAGGVVTFDCGASPVTIPITSELPVTTDVVLDGGSTITLDGGGQTRILAMDTGNFEATSPHLWVQRMAFTGGHASGTSIPLGTDIDGGGGAIFYLGGSVTVVDCTFVNNTAAEFGPDVAGGAIYGIGVGETMVVGSTFAGNRAANGGALGALHTGLTVFNSDITGNVATGYGANYIDEWGDQQGHGGNGGAIVMDGVGRTLHLCGTTIAGNTGGAYGGALFRTSYESEPSIIDRCDIDGNEVSENPDPEMPSAGGGLYLQGTAVTLVDSTVSNNAARGYAGVWIMGHGDASGVADLTNVTLTGNATYPKDPFTDRGIGGGLIIGSNATGTVLNCTIASNEAQFGSGIINVSPLTVINTIIANEADNEWTPLNCTGSSYDNPPGSGEHDLQWPQGQADMDCVSGITYAEPMMGTLGDHGGPTPTIPPLPGSPTLQAGWGCPPTDQRGEPRSEPCTLGAYEVIE